MSFPNLINDDVNKLVNKNIIVTGDDEYSGGGEGLASAKLTSKASTDRYNHRLVNMAAEIHEIINHGVVDDDDQNIERDPGIPKTMMLKTRRRVYFGS